MNVLQNESQLFTTIISRLKTTSKINCALFNHLLKETIFLRSSEILEFFHKNIIF